MSGQGGAKGLPAGVQRPPSKEYVDEVSKDQGLIADEWAPEPAGPAGETSDEEAGG